MATAAANPLLRFEDSNGDPLAGGTLEFYESGSSTPKTAYGDSSESTSFTTKTLDSRGEAVVYFGSGNYKLVVKDSGGSTIKTLDPVIGAVTSSSSSSEWSESGMTPTYVSATSFTVSGDQTSILAVGIRIKATVTAGTVYGEITDSEYTSLTTVTVRLDSGSLDSGLSDLQIGINTPTNPSISIKDVYALSDGLGRRNAVINGAMEVAQRSATNLSITAAFGAVDRFACWADGTVGAGTITQSTSAALATAKTALHLSGVTLTGSGVVYQRTRLEASDAQHFLNKTASFSCWVKHDVGSSKNYTITIRKADAENNFSAATVIQTGSAVSVGNNTATQLKLENISMGDCGNGIEIEVKCECGAVTTKNFYTSEWQFEPGPVANSFEFLSIADVWAQCNRYLFNISHPSARAIIATGLAYSTTNAAFSIVLPTPMRATPTLSSANLHVTNGSATLIAGTSSSLTGIDSQRRSVLVDVTVASGLTAGQASLLYAGNAAGGNISLSAEL
jgi:hypothetical protein